MCVCTVCVCLCVCVQYVCMCVCTVCVCIWDQFWGNLPKPEAIEYGIFTKSVKLMPPAFIALYLHVYIALYFDFLLFEI